MFAGHPVRLRRAGEPICWAACGGAESSHQTIAMGDWYYDNEFEPVDESRGLAKIERVYCLDWGTFSEKEANELVRIYASLPGWIEDLSAASDLYVPYWFGCDEDHPPYLWLSAEPSGLL